MSDQDSAVDPAVEECEILASPDAWVGKTVRRKAGGNDTLYKVTSVNDRHGSLMLRLGWADPLVWASLFEIVEDAPAGEPEDEPAVEPAPEDLTRWLGETVRVKGGDGTLRKVIDANWSKYRERVMLLLEGDYYRVRADKFEIVEPEVEPATEECENLALSESWVGKTVRLAAPAAWEEDRTWLVVKDFEDRAGTRRLTLEGTILSRSKYLFTLVEPEECENLASGMSYLLDWVDDGVVTPLYRGDDRAALEEIRLSALKVMHAAKTNGTTDIAIHETVVVS